MQNTDADKYLDDLIVESRIPVSTLRSTASPYKPSRISISLGSYGEHLASLKLRKFQELPKLSVGRDLSPNTPSCALANLPASIAFPFHASDASTSSPQEEESISPLDTISCDDEDAAKALSTAPSTPWTIPSSPLSASADIPSALDSLQDEDTDTESDRAPSLLSLPNPLSQPSTATAITASTTSNPRIAVIIPEKTESGTSSKCSPSSSRPRSTPRSNSLEVTSNGRNQRKRRRSPSPASRPRIRSLNQEDAVDRMDEKTASKDKGKGTKGNKSLRSLSPNSRKASDELVGPLVQTLVLSGKSSLPTSSIVDGVLDSAPSLKPQRTTEEWTSLIVLTMATRSMFGKAERKGLKNADNETVEDEWYYRPECDSDEDRRETLSIFQRGGGKRRATVQKKQYYWKPVK
ncbi:hypothetical protein FS842_004134 [Serendipita sp. 407]|nr:hypothetical protein FS842_004134 [Serendipita sp. 407]